MLVGICCYFLKLGPQPFRRPSLDEPSWPSGEARLHGFTTLIVALASVDRCGAIAAKTRAPTNEKITAARTTVVVFIVL